MIEERLDRFARGELSAEESRALAQEALDTPDLFEEMTCAAMARTGLADRRPRRTVWPRLAALAAALVVGAVALYTLRHSTPEPTATLALSGPPVFLAHTLDAAAQFRGAEPESRAPRAEGSITAVADGTASVDLGSLDGLAKGSEVEVLRNGTPAGKIGLDTIFRERARGQVARGLTVQPADRVRVPAALYLRAVLDQIAALVARGDTAGAQRMAGLAAADPNLAVASPDYADWNNLGAMAALRGDRDAARRFYRRALQANPPGDARREIENNLARSGSAQ